MKEHLVHTVTVPEFLTPGGKMNFAARLLITGKKINRPNNLARLRSIPQCSFNEVVELELVLVGYQ